MSKDKIIADCAVDVTGRIAPFLGAGPGSTPRTALQQIVVNPIPRNVAKKILVAHHYLHSFPGCTELCFGAFSGSRLLGAITFGAGPANAFRLVEGASIEDCLTLTRLWLSDELPPNSESRIIGICLRALKKHTRVKFLVSYADPALGHLGIIYQAGGWLYTGLSEATPKFDIGDGVARHSRSLAQTFGSHSLKYLSRQGLKIEVLPQIPKHRYIYFLDPKYRNRLKTPALPYPKKEKYENR